jgi:hypothetical protein
MPSPLQLCRVIARDHARPSPPIILAEFDEEKSRLKTQADILGNRTCPKNPRGNER